jgi:hypothetical protein
MYTIPECAAELGGDCGNCPYRDDCPVIDNNMCTRTGRKCIGGAYDGEDGLGIDCPESSPNHCIYRK